MIKDQDITEKIRIVVFSELKTIIFTFQFIKKKINDSHSLKNKYSISPVNTSFVN